MWDVMGGNAVERGRSRSPQPMSFPIPHPNGPSFGFSGPISSSYPPAVRGFPPYVAHAPSQTHGIQLTPPPSAPAFATHYQPHPPQVIHIVHHSVHHRKHKDKEKEKESKDPKKSARSQSKSREIEHHSLHHAYSSSRLNVAISTAIPFPISRSNPSPTLPSKTLHVPHQRSRSHSLTQMPQPQVHFLKQPTSASPPGHSVKPPPSNVLQKPRPSFSRTDNIGNSSGARLPTPTLPSPLQLTPPPQLKPLHGILKPSTHQPLSGPNPTFQYSQCTGRKRALCIGVNYTSQPNALRGCINDARHVRDFLVKHGGYRISEILLLTDEPPKGTREGDGWDSRMVPTRENIIRGMKWLVRGARRDDSLFFHYSGHGGQTRDLNGDEVDGFDEVIYPVDFRTAGHIIDDEMHDIMVKPLPMGCRLTGLFDSCHSGTVLDLPYIYSPHGRLKGSFVSPKGVKMVATPADVISWSSCKDGETSSDTFAGGVAVGAMSYAFITTLGQNPHQTYQELLRSLRLILNPRFSQRPQLGSAHHIDTNRQFVF